MTNGVVGSNTHRELDPEESRRGLALVDDYAPLVFINGAGTKAAQIFALAHELVHMWVGEAALTDATIDSEPAGRVERWCNEVAAELLVPVAELEEAFDARQALTSELERLARHFEVSTLVVLRRLHDTGHIGLQAYRTAYRDELDRILDLIAERETTGGSYYNTQPTRVSKRFAKLEALGGRRYTTGDQVVMLTPDRDGRWVTSERGTVAAVDGGALVVRFDADREVALAGPEINEDHLGRAYAVTVHRIQGATVDTAHVLADGGGRELAYIAMSRARGTTHVHAVADDLDQASENLAREWTTERRDRWLHDLDTLATEGDRLRPTLDREPDAVVREFKLRPEVEDLTEVLGEASRAPTQGRRPHPPPRHHPESPPPTRPGPLGGDDGGPVDAQARHIDPVV